MTRPCESHRRGPGSIGSRFEVKAANWPPIRPIKKKRTSESLYAIVMGMDDATLNRLRQWLNVWHDPFEPKLTSASRAASRARDWRDRRRGRPPRPVTNWKTAKVCALAQHPLTPENVRVAPNGQRSCRLCLNQRIREWRRKGARPRTSCYKKRKTKPEVISVFRWRWSRPGWCRRCVARSPRSAGSRIGPRSARRTARAGSCCSAGIPPGVSRRPARSTARCAAASHAILRPQLNLPGDAGCRSARIDLRSTELPVRRPRHRHRAASDRRQHAVVGADSGGIWRTTDGGVTWTSLTDAIPVPAIASLVIDPRNPSLLYATTIHRTYPIRLLRSTDGGTTWTVTPIEIRRERDPAARFARG